MTSSNTAVSAASPGSPAVTAPATQPHQQAGGVNYHGGDRTYGTNPWVEYGLIGGLFGTNVLLAWLLAKRYGYDAGRRRRLRTT